MFLAEYDLEEFPLLLWSLLLLLISGLLLLNITSCSSPATKCDFVILSVSCSSHISWKGIIILIEEEKKYRILYVCVHMYTRNRRVKGERSEEGIKWINTNNKIWSSVFVPSNFTFFFFWSPISFHFISNCSDMQNGRHMKWALSHEPRFPALQSDSMSTAGDTLKPCDAIASWSSEEQGKSKVCEWNHETHPQVTFQKHLTFKNCLYSDFII